MMDGWVWRGQTFRKKLAENAPAVRGCRVSLSFQGEKERGRKELTPQAAEKVQQRDASAFRGLVPNKSKVQVHEVYDGKHGHADDEVDQEHQTHVPLNYQLPGDHGSLQREHARHDSARGHGILVPQPCDRQQAADYQRCDHTGRIPGILATGPCESQHEQSDTPEEQSLAAIVDCRQPQKEAAALRLLAPQMLFPFFRLFELQQRLRPQQLTLEEDEGQNHGQRGNREVDGKTPTPADFGEVPSRNRPNGKAEGANDGEDGPGLGVFGEVNAVGKDSAYTYVDAGSAYALEGTAKEEGAEGCRWGSGTVKSGQDTAQAFQ